MSNYIIEIWYLPDTRYISYIGDSPTKNLHVFKTNALAIYRGSGANDLHYFSNAVNTSAGFNLDSKNYWNKLIISVKLTGSTYATTFYNNKFTATTAASTNTSCNLTKICFCQNYLIFCSLKI